MSININGIIIGAAVFLSIGICHPLVIKAEYYWGRKSWWIWLVAGLALCTYSQLSSGALPFAASGASTKCSCKKNACCAAGSRRIPNGTTTMPPSGRVF